MAFKTPVATVDTTGTSGTSTYTLNAATPADGKQNLQQAVTKGVVSNGDVIYYLAIDITTKGPTLLYERGKGTVGNGGLTVTRDEIFENHLGTTSAFSWSAGGTRAFIVNAGDFVNAENNGTEFNAATFATNLGLPRLAAANVFTEAQAIQKSGSAAVALNLDSTQAGSTGNGLILRQRLKNDAGSTVDAVRYRASFPTITAGSEASSLEISTMVAGVLAVRAQIVGGVFRDGSGNKYDAFPAGQVLLSESVPPGWTRGDVTGGRLIKLATSADTLGAQGGSDDFFDGALATQGHTLQITEVPAHTHPVNYNAQDIPVGTGASTHQLWDSSFGTSGTKPTDSTGGGGPHAHLITTPNYRVMGRIVKS